MKTIKVKITPPVIYEEIVIAGDPEDEMDEWVAENPLVYALEVAKERFKDNLADGLGREFYQNIKYEIVVP